MLKGTAKTYEGPTKEFYIVFYSPHFPATLYCACKYLATPGNTLFYVIQ